MEPHEQASILINNGDKRLGAEGLLRMMYEDGADELCDPEQPLGGPEQEEQPGQQPRLVPPLADH